MPPRMIPAVTTAITIARAIVHPNSATVGRASEDSGSGPRAYALVLSPVKEPIPIETSVPIPAASMPGRSTTLSFGPPSPVASSRITAAISGEVKINASAAKLPAAATTINACGGVSRRAIVIISVATPAPNAISGPSAPAPARSRWSPGRPV